MKSVVWRNRITGKYLTYLERVTHTGRHFEAGETDDLNLATQVSYLHHQIQNRRDYDSVDVIVTVTLAEPVETGVSCSNDLLYAVNALDVSLRPDGPIERAVFNGLKDGNDSAPAIAIQRCQKHMATIKTELGI